MCYPGGSDKRAGGPNLFHLDAEVFGKERLCRLCGKNGEYLANQSYGKGNRTALLQCRTGLKKDPVTLNMQAVSPFETNYNTPTDPKEDQLINLTVSLP